MGGAFSGVVGEMSGAARTRRVLMNTPRLRLIADYRAPLRAQIHRDGDVVINGALPILEVAARKEAKQQVATEVRDAARFHV